MRKKKSNAPPLATFALCATVATALLSALITLILAFPVEAQAAAAAVTADPELVKWGYAAAVASTSVSTVAAAYAVARVGTAAVGAAAENPDLFGRLVVLVGLAEGIAIYGLIVSILLLNQLS